jgi:hypothetical protein
MKGFKHTGIFGQSGHHFPSSFGFTGSAGQSSVKGHMRTPYSHGGKTESHTKTHFADGVHVIGEKTRPSKDGSHDSDRGHIIGEDTRQFKKGGKTRIKGALHAALNGAHHYRDGGKVEKEPRKKASPKTSSDVRSPTSTDVRSPTSTKTSTHAVTKGNKTSTSTDGSYNTTNYYAGAHKPDGVGKGSAKPRAKAGPVEPTEPTEPHARGGKIVEHHHHYKKRGRVHKADGGHVSEEHTRIPRGESGSSDRGHITGEGTRQFKKGGKTHFATGGSFEPHSIPPHTMKQDAPHGMTNFQDYKKGGRKRGLKKGGAYC